MKTTDQHTTEKTFTELFCNWQETERELQDAREAHGDNYEFGYLYHETIKVAERARDELNEAFALRALSPTPSA